MSAASADNCRNITVAAATVTPINTEAQSDHPPEADAARDKGTDEGSKICGFLYEFMFCPSWRLCVWSIVAPLGSAELAVGGSIGETRCCLSSSGWIDCNVRGGSTSKAGCPVRI